MLRHSFGGTVIFISLQHFIFYGKDLFVLISVVCFDQLSGAAAPENWSNNKNQPKKLEVPPQEVDQGPIL